MNNQSKQSTGKMHSTEKKNDAKTTPSIDKPKLLACTCAVLFALTVGTVVWAGVNISGAAGEVAEVKATTKPAVVANTTIPAGTVVALDSVRIIDVPETYLVEDVVTDPALIIGKTATANISANAQITQLNLAGEGNSSALAEALEPNMVAAAIAVNSETGVAGLVRQGDYVDVLAEGGTLIERARVLALDTQLTGEITQYSTVTLEVTAEQAGDVQAAQMDSTVRLVLNSQAAHDAEAV